MASPGPFEEDEEGGVKTELSLDARLKLLAKYGDGSVTSSDMLAGRTVGDVDGGGGVGLGGVGLDYRPNYDEAGDVGGGSGGGGSGGGGGGGGGGGSADGLAWKEAVDENGQLYYYVATYSRPQPGAAPTLPPPSAPPPSLPPSPAPPPARRKPASPSEYLDRGPDGRLYVRPDTTPPSERLPPPETVRKQRVAIRHSPPSGEVLARRSTGGVPQSRVDELIRGVPEMRGRLRAAASLHGECCDSV